MGLYGLYKSKRDSKFNIYLYFKPNNQEIRWIVPLGLKKPVFLDMYYRGTLRSNLIYLLYKLIFFFGIQPLFASGFIKVSKSIKLPIDTIREHLKTEDFSIYTGKPGPGRTSVTNFVLGNKQIYYLKKSLSNDNSDNNKEFIVLNQLRSMQPTTFKFPEIIAIQGSYLQSDIKPKLVRTVNQIQDVHVAPVLELFDRTILNKTPYDFKRKLTENIKPILNSSIIEESDKERIKYVSNIFNEGQWPSSIMHGDYTPWNMYVGKDIVHIYDWENSQYAPVFFDLFHFTIQSEFYLRKERNAGKVMNEIQKVFKRDELVNAIREYNINADAHFSFYLLYIIGFYSKKLRPGDIEAENRIEQLRLWTTCLELHYQIPVIDMNFYQD